jgi:hypothetical protein
MSAVPFSRDAYGTLLLVLAAPTLLPGLGFLTAPLAGLAGLAVGVQLAVGRRAPWMPSRARAWMDDASLGPRLSLWLQDRLRPLQGLRLPRLPRVLAGLAVCWSSLLLVLPLVFVPFGNAIPALALALLGVGLAVRRSLFGWLGTALSGGYTAFLALLGEALVLMARDLAATPS